ncbi:hypothetical protein ACIBI4_13950 [Streptomyces sp. NPDC050418]|uniref:hypothetical protein n=1 Tax=Streptomyces sp. NPDC050418 TaxID=3365612 RepID=UPI00378FEEB5
MAAGSQRYKRHDHRSKRYEKQLSGLRMQINVSSSNRLSRCPRAVAAGGTSTTRPRRSTTAIGSPAEDGLRLLSVPRFHPMLNQATANQFVGYVLQRLFPSRGDPDRQRGRVRVHVASTYSTKASATPTSSPTRCGSTAWSNDLTGSTQETHRLLDGVIIDDAEVYNSKLREREDYRNDHRHHGGQTPY